MIHVVAPIVGSRYQKDGVRRLNGLHQGQKLTLRPEPDNEYDRNAVLVLSDEGPLGHVSATFSRTVAMAIRRKGDRVRARYDGRSCVLVSWPEKT